MDETSIPVVAAMRADIDQQGPRILWQDPSERNVALSAMWMAGASPEDIARRFEITVPRAVHIAKAFGLVRFARVDVQRKRVRTAPDFWDNVPYRGAGCWEWTGPRDRAGYGTWGNFRAHRLVLSTALGRALKADEFACHRCDNPPCVRPDHLFVGTAHENSLDMVAKGRLNSRDRNWGR